MCYPPVRAPYRHRTSRSSKRRSSAALLPSVPRSHQPGGGGGGGPHSEGSLPNPVLAALEVSAACHSKARLYTRDRRRSMVILAV